MINFAIAAPVDYGALQFAIFNQLVSYALMIAAIVVTWLLAKFGIRKLGINWHDVLHGLSSGVASKSEDVDTSKIESTKPPLHSMEEIKTELEQQRASSYEIQGSLPYVETRVTTLRAAGIQIKGWLSIAENGYWMLTFDNADGNRIRLLLPPTHVFEIIDPPVVKLEVTTTIAPTVGIVFGKPR